MRAYWSEKARQALPILYKKTVFIMTNKPPIARAELHATQERNRQSLGAMALLWEIASLRSAMLHE